MLLSGGLDSAVVLWWAKERGWPLATLHFVFPGRRKREMEAAHRLESLAQVTESYKVDLPFVQPPAAQQACYIPSRNLMFYGVAASLAQTIGARYILGGHYSHDAEVFPDARPNYFDSIERLIQTGQKSTHPVRFIFPFLKSSKEDIIRTSVELKVPVTETWSCSHDGKWQCGECNSCRERREGYVRAGIPDPFLGSLK